jgi:hypothetical protein
MACFSRINRAMDAPMGPTPYWMARIFFFTSFSAFRSHARTTRIFGFKGNPYDNGIPARIQRRTSPGQASSRTSICGQRAGATRWLLA